MADITQMSALELLDAYKNDRLTVEQSVSALLSRISDRDGTVRAWVHLDPEQVLVQARQADKIPKSQRGPLHGVPVAIKDVMYTKQMPTQHGSNIYAMDQPELDAASVKMLRNAGAIIMGKSTTTEFAASTVGPPTTNPHDPRRTPGGSSSGSAAAVADYQVPLALGTQTAGSIIRPASFTGIFGMKPTWNAVSREGQKLSSINLDTLGWFARSVQDLALLGRVFGVADDEPPRPLVDGVRGARIAFLQTILWDEYAGPGTRTAMDQGAAWLREAGASVERLVLPTEFDCLPEMQRVMMRGDGASAFRCEYLDAKDQLDSYIVDCVENPPTHRAYLQAFDTIAALRPRWDNIAAQFDAIVVPSAPDEAPEGLGFTGNQIFNAMWTALHAPVINIPAFLGPNKLPVGLTVVQARYKDEALLQVAQAIADVWVDREDLNSNS